VTDEANFSLLLEEFLDDATNHLDAAEAALLELEKNFAGGGNPDAGFLTLILGHFHTLKGNAGMMGFSPLQQYVHKLESILKQVVDGTAAMTPVFCESCYNAVNVLRGTLRALAENPAVKLDLHDEMKFLECLVMHGTSETSSIAVPAGSQVDFAYTTRKSGTMKVNFEKLDELLNLVGELVIHRTSLVSLEARLIEKVSDSAIIESFRESSHLLGKTANDLRDAIMKVRMLPIRVVFQRFNRLVRDLSRRHDKEINLVFEGEETELDKTVIDEIDEPLLHLIRNAVDHGIEGQEERKRLGKAPSATIKLQAYHENSCIVIAVEDDGGGMSAGRIRDSAVAKGLVTVHEAQALNDREALHLVFLPGFSTSHGVTETSGRGIGLDVVKKTVTALKGSIDISSFPGKGTSFIIKLPLTLAIIQALMVEVAGETYAIPLSEVQESIMLEPAEIHPVAAGEIINLREKLLPIVRLDRFFGFEKTTAREMEYIVIVGSGEKRSGIVVERLLGQQEIVIKAMQDYLGELPGISGGTVLGDGKISLVLDIASITGKLARGGSDARD
jgi:two-component system chemotaxis sensor kinase CheA